MNVDAPYPWRFFRAGDVDQVQLRTGADLLALDRLDPKLWVALACPTGSIQFDARTVQLLDVNGDGRIRVSDIVTAVKWLKPLLKDPEDLVGGKDTLPLGAINDATPEGKVPRIEAGRPLALADGLNPAWAARLHQLRDEVLRPVLRDPSLSTLTEPAWLTVKASFAPHAAWLSRKKGARVETLGRARLESLVAPALRETLMALIIKDRGLETLASALLSVERLLHLVRDLQAFCRNFVNFRDFYGQEQLATFQAGTLYIDQRSCELCLVVENRTFRRVGSLAGRMRRRCNPFPNRFRRSRRPRRDHRTSGRQAPSFGSASSGTPNSFCRFLNVLYAMPSARAAWDLLPPASPSARTMS